MPFLLGERVVDSDRRSTFRAGLAETREGLLVTRGRNCRVRIVDESSGGLCVSTRRSCELSNGTETRLSTDDGDNLAVRVVYCRKEGTTTMIGLQRLGPAPLDTSRRGTRPLILLVGLTIGLYAGFTVQTHTVQQALAHIPSLSQLVSHN